MDTDLIIILSAFYVLMLATIAKAGSAREIGGKKALLWSVLLTPVGGFFVVYSSPKKNILNITH